MIHEVMVLDHSGPTFAMILYAKALKLFVFAGLVVHLVLPFGTGSRVVDWFVYLLGTVALAVLVGIVESAIARLRLVEIPKLLIGAGVLSLLGMILLLSQP
jgi:formate hydrogenlyase subunit 4